MLPGALSIYLFNFVFHLTTKQNPAQSALLADKWSYFSMVAAANKSESVFTAFLWGFLSLKRSGDTSAVAQTAKQTNKK